MTDNPNVIKEALKPTISGPFYSCDDCLEYGDGNCYPPKGLRVWEGRVYCKDCFDTGPGEGSDGLDWDEAEPFPDTTRTPESQEMFAVENKEQIIGVEVEPFRADMRADNMQSFNPEFGPYKVVSVIVTKKED